MIPAPTEGNTQVILGGIMLGVSLLALWGILMKKRLFIYIYVIFYTILLIFLATLLIVGFCTMKNNRKSPKKTAALICNTGM